MSENLMGGIFFDSHCRLRLNWYHIHSHLFNLLPANRQIHVAAGRHASVRVSHTTHSKPLLLARHVKGKEAEWAW